MPKGDVPGEWYSPTQPFPTKPPAYARQGVTLERPDRLHAGAARRGSENLVSQYRLGPMYTPPAVSKVGGPLATLVLPSPAGGTNWPGAAYDPETHIVYAYAQDTITPLGSGLRPTASILGHGLRSGTGRRAVPASRAAAARAKVPAPISLPPPARLQLRLRQPRTAALLAAGIQRAGPAAPEAALRPHLGDQYGSRAKSSGRCPTARRRTSSATIPALKGLNIPNTGQAGYVTGRW